MIFKSKAKHIFNIFQQTLSPSKTSLNQSKGLTEDPEVQIPKKVPRKIIHCSDGIYEEYSTDEEPEETEQKQITDPKTLSWIPWMMYYSWLAGSTVFYYADSWGESLAW